MHHQVETSNVNSTGVSGRAADENVRVARSPGQRDSGRPRTAEATMLPAAGVFSSAARRTLARLATLGLLLGVSGCVAPWAGQSRVALPTTDASPTTKVAPAPQEPVNPNLDIDIDVEQATLGEGTQELQTSESDIIRGQTPVTPVLPREEDGMFRETMPMSGDGSSYDNVPYHAAPYGGAGHVSYGPGGGAGISAPRATAQGYGPSYSTYDGSAVAQPYGGGPGRDPDGLLQPLPSDYADLVVNLRETQTGRFMFGVGVNSDLGLTAQAIIDERNFDWRRWPRSLSEVTNGTAWRGGGQNLRIEAVPGSQVQRYIVNYTQPYLFDTLPISFSLSGFLFDRRYFDWDEQRLGGRMGLGYRITPDLSLGASIRGEQVDLHNVRLRGIPILERAIGENDLFSGRLSLTHDTRDIPFAPTEGHFLELSVEQVFGSFDYSKAGLDYRRYFLLRERIDRSGRHTLGFSFKGGITGSDTPVYENYFAGGYSTLRGFRFRHASPKIADITVGGQLSLLGSVEYIFPITADDMLRGAMFCDYGTIEETYDNIDADDFRVAVGAGLRINVPAMGPAPIAVDFAVPIAREDTDRIQNFSFFVGFGR